MSNICYLSNGQNFIINPDKEEDYAAAINSKKVFLLSLNVTSLSTEKKTWTAETIRHLATGMVHIVSDGKRATKAVLIERLTTFIRDELVAVSISDSNDMEYVEGGLEDCSFSVDKLKVVMETLTGNDLVDSLTHLILSRALAPSTITKTVLPDISKMLTAHYPGDDVSVVRGTLYRRFRAMNLKVDKMTNKALIEKTENRPVTDWNTLAPFIDNILDNIDTVSWKHLSFAIALATGRRMAEVHGDATSFSVVDSGQVLFSGQLKTKTKGVNPPAVIPCVFDAYKVFGAWERLREVGRASYSPEAVHRSLSKALSTQMPEDIKAIKGACNLVAYKDNRDCYAAYCLLSKPPQYSTNRYLAIIMGHGENDLGTASAYDKRVVTV